MPRTAVLGHAQHLRTRVHTDDDALGADLADQLGAIEARSASDVENALTRGCSQRISNQTPPPNRVADPIERLQLFRGVFIEYELAHRVSLTAHLLNDLGRLRLAG